MMLDIVVKFLSAIPLHTYDIKVKVPDFETLCSSSMLKFLDNSYQKMDLIHNWLDDRYRYKVSLSYILQLPKILRSRSQTLKFHLFLKLIYLKRYDGFIS